MLFIPNQLQKEKEQARAARQLQLGIIRGQQQAIEANNNGQPLTQQDYEIMQAKRLNQQRRQQAYLEQLEQQKVVERNETFAKILAIIGLLLALVGIGLLAFGIVQNQMYGYIAGPILLVVGILCYVIMGVLLYKASHQKKRSYQPTTRNQVSPRHSREMQVTNIA